MYNCRQQAILSFIKAKKYANRTQIQQYIMEQFDKSSKITVLRDLNLLIKENLIIKSGKTKAALYTIYPSSALMEDINVEDYFKIDADKRILKSEKFNFDIWEHLTNIFTKKEKEELEIFNQKFINNKLKLSKTLYQKELERITVELAWKSSKIEGNTYTLLDTERLFKENISAKGKTKEETAMILNHKTALEFVLQKPDYYKELTIAKIENIHTLLVEDLHVEKGIRNGMVGIVGTNYKPLDNAYQIKEALQKLTEIINNTENPIEKALIIVLMIAYIQPFEDGNKRTSRILGNALLLANNYCPLSYRSVDEVEYKKAVILFYEQNKASYFKQIFIDQFKQAVQKYFG